MNAEEGLKMLSTMTQKGENITRIHPGWTRIAVIVLEAQYLSTFVSRQAKARVENTFHITAIGILQIHLYVTAFTKIGENIKTSSSYASLYHDNTSPDRESNEDHNKRELESD